MTFPYKVLEKDQFASLPIVDSSMAFCTYRMFCESGSHWPPGVAASSKHIHNPVAWFMALPGAQLQVKNPRTCVELHLGTVRARIANVKIAAKIMHPITTLRICMVLV